jgi:hypothetical protein
MKDWLFRIFSTVGVTGDRADFFTAVKLLETFPTE